MEIEKAPKEWVRKQEGAEASALDLIARAARIILWNPEVEAWPAGG